MRTVCAILIAFLLSSVQMDSFTAGAKQPTNVVKDVKNPAKVCCQQGAIYKPNKKK